VVAFFSAQLEKSGPSPYSAASVLETIVKASKSWPRNRLRVSVKYVNDDLMPPLFKGHPLIIDLPMKGLNEINATLAYYVNDLDRPKLLCCECEEWRADCWLYILVPVK